MTYSKEIAKFALELVDSMIVYEMSVMRYDTLRSATPTELDAVRLGWLQRVRQRVVADENLDLTSAMQLAELVRDAREVAQ